MKLTPVIARLKTAAPLLAGRVAGTAEFEAALDARELAVPHGFVMPLAEGVRASRTAPLVVQAIDERFAVIVAVANTADPRGQAGAELLHDIRAQLWSALIDWPPAADLSPCEYRGGRHLTMTRGRLWHQYDFACLAVIGS